MFHRRRLIETVHSESASLQLVADPDDKFPKFNEVFPVQR